MVRERTDAFEMPVRNPPCLFSALLTSAHTFRVSTPTFTHLSHYEDPPTFDPMSAKHKLHWLAPISN